MNSIIIGTRGSNLALIQANTVKSLLEGLYPEMDVSLKIYKTKGDKVLDSALSKIGDKGLFTRELEVGLYNGEIHMAVHSLKDLPTELPEGIVLGGVLPREDVRDALISRDGRTLDQMKAGDVIATSSLRRSSQLLRYNPGFKIVDIRGNIETRIRKMEEGLCDATLLACAGLNRAGYTDKISDALDPQIIMPAVSQGIIGIEVLDTSHEVKEILSSLTDKDALVMAEAERTFLRLLEGGCQVPVAAYSRIEGEEFLFSGMVSRLDGSEQIHSDLKGPLSEAVNIAANAAKVIIEEGGDRILKEIKEQNSHG